MSQPNPDLTSLPWVDLVPDVTTPKTLGVLNILFALVLMACGTCYGMQIALQPIMAPFTAAQQQQVQAAMNAERAAALQKLDEQEKAAKTDEEKIQFQARRKTLVAQPVPRIPDFTKIWTGDQRLIAYFVGDITSGLLLNVLLFISGIGLLSLRGWARGLALWVAGAKVLRLLVLTAFFMLAILPGLASRTKGLFEEMFQNQPPGAGAPSREQLETMVAVMGIMSTVWILALAVFGVIYPAILLWQLSRERVKAAFVPLALPAENDLPGPDRA